jgi:hypothetical protein
MHELLCWPSAAGYSLHQQLLGSYLADKQYASMSKLACSLHNKESKKYGQQQVMK